MFRYQVLACLGLCALASLPVTARPLDQVVAVVNKEVVVRSELDKEVQRILSDLESRGTRAPPREALERQVLDHLVIQKLQLQLAELQNVRVDDEQVNTALETIAGNNKLTLSQLREAVGKEGLSYADFREQIRREMIVAELRQKEVTNRINVTDAEVDNFLATEGAAGGRDSRYHLAHILITFPEGAAPEEIAKSQRRAEQLRERLLAGEDFGALAVEYSKGQQALQGGDLGWRRLNELPVLFADAVTGLPGGALTPVIRSATGFHLLKVVQEEGEERHVVEQTRARHILIITDPTKGEDDARARIEALRTRIGQGEDFGDLARAHSDDAASAVNGGDLGWVTSERLDPAFVAAMEALPIGEVSRPVRSRFGVHLIQVQERRRQDDTEGFRRTRAREVLRARKSEDQTQRWLQRMRDEAYVELRVYGVKESDAPSSGANSDTAPPAPEALAPESSDAEATSAAPEPLVVMPTEP